MLKKAILTGTLLLICANSRAFQWAIKVNSVSRQNCTLKIRRQNKSFTYENLGTQLPTFVQSTMRELPVAQRFNIDSQSNHTDIRFSRQRLFETAMSAYANCFSVEMAQSIELTKNEANAYLMPISPENWLDICIKNEDGFQGRCINGIQLPDGGLGIDPNSKEHACSNVASSEFLLVNRTMGPNGFLSLSSPAPISLGTISGAGTIRRSLGDTQVDIACTTSTKQMPAGRAR